ncbi:MAG: hypothetical protein OXU22_08870 [Gammaproteobacteria bacterium]|nr:hypothetical protein [Gammaproteobacteria bacterium]
MTFKIRYFIVRSQCACHPYGRLENHRQLLTNLFDKPVTSVPETGQRVVLLQAQNLSHDNCEVITNGKKEEVNFYEAQDGRQKGGQEESVKEKSR